jgi:pyruvate dehydrogenase E2 component (dihydrolipoamide acetyltransferase)
MHIMTMPQASNTMDEGTIVCWRKREGETVDQGEILLEIETDKATVEVESPAAGTLRAILVPVGEVVPIRAPLAILADPGESIDAALAEAKSQLNLSSAPSAAPAATPSAASAPASQSTPPSDTAVPIPHSALTSVPGGRAKASPAARRVAAERGVELAMVGAGSGPGGRILSTDVPDSAYRIAPSAVSSSSPSGPGRPLAGMRRAIAKNLTLSKQTIPHFYMKLTVDADPMLRLYKSGPGRSPFTLNDIVIAGCARCMAEMPAFRGRLENDRIVDYPTANVGIAVGKGDALVVPVLIGADQLSLRQIGASTRRLVADARAGKVAGSGQGQLTISNLGMFGVEEFSAIINPPEVAILAVGAIREEVIVRDGAMRAGRALTLVMSADHRVIDGMAAAGFLARLKELLERAGQSMNAE